MEYRTVNTKAAPRGTAPVRLLTCPGARVALQRGPILLASTCKSNYLCQEDISIELTEGTFLSRNDIEITNEITNVNQ